MVRNFCEVQCLDSTTCITCTVRGASAQLVQQQRHRGVLSQQNVPELPCAASRPHPPAAGASSHLANAAQHHGSATAGSAQQQHRTCQGSSSSSKHRQSSALPPLSSTVLPFTMLGDAHRNRPAMWQGKHPLLLAALLHGRTPWFKRNTLLAYAPTNNLLNCPQPPEQAREHAPGAATGECGGCGPGFHALVAAR